MRYLGNVMRKHEERYGRNPRNGNFGLVDDHNTSGPRSTDYSSRSMSERAMLGNPHSKTSYEQLEDMHRRNAYRLQRKYDRMRADSENDGSAVRTGGSDLFPEYDYPYDVNEVEEQLNHERDMAERAYASNLYGRDVYHRDYGRHPYESTGHHGGLHPIRGATDDELMELVDKNYTSSDVTSYFRKPSGYYEFPSIENEPIHELIRRYSKNRDPKILKFLGFELGFDEDSINAYIRENINGKR